jgi:hypothetical protein
MTSRPSTAPLKVRPLSTGRLRPRIVQVDNSARTDLSGGSSAPRRAREIDTSAGSRGQYEKEVLPPLSVLLQPFGIEEGELNRMNMKDRRKRVLRGIVETLGRDRGETERQNENVHRGSDGDSRDYLDYVPPPILEHQPADIFSWLRLNTKYPNLRALLRARLIEVLTEGGNAAKIREKVEAIDAEQTGNTDRFIRPQDRRIEREYLQHPRSRRGEESSRGSTFRTPHPQFVSNPAKIEAHLLSQVHLSKDKYTPQNSDQQTFSKYRLDGQKISEKWNKKDEEIYK